MMIDMCSDTSPPRISFSNDIGPADDARTVLESRRDMSLLDSNCDLEFSFTSSNYVHDESCPADELFSHGVILPTQPQPRDRDRARSPKQRKFESSPPPLPPLPSPRKESTKEAMDVEQKPQSDPKSFWGFKRCSSLNHDSKRSLLCSLPLLLRSNSTGSVSNSKRSFFKDFNKRGAGAGGGSNSKQPSSISMAKSASVSSTSSSSSSFSNPYALLQKPLLKKNHGGGGGGSGSYGNGVRIIPVINVRTPSYISKGTAKLSGLGSFLHHGKDKKTKK